jgi:hypothetical protein
MKKIIYIFLLIGVITTPIDINRKVNIYEDAEIINKYGSHLENIDEKDYKPILSGNAILTETTSFDNSVMNSNDINIKHLFSPINVLDNFEYNVNDFNELLNRNLNLNLSGRIRESILNLTKNNINYIENIFVEKNDDINKFKEFKNELIAYSESKIDIFGRDVDGKYVNIDSSQVHNNIIEIELD